MTAPNPYAPPRSIADDGERFQDEIDALAPTWKIRMAWGSVAATGFLAALAGAQLLAGPDSARDSSPSRH